MARRATVGVGVASRRLRLGGGSVIGGRVGLLLDPHLLHALGAGRRVALVSGTNGKTTTTKLLTAALGGTTVIATSPAGANMAAGMAAALAGAPTAATAVLEVDEGYLGRAVEALAPEVIVLLNLSRDQLDRVNEVRMVAARWRSVT
jgi:lipid II isoglutaminyl synthase (glutamine-hydrolysing)